MWGDTYLQSASRRSLKYSVNSTYFGLLYSLKLLNFDVRVLGEMGEMGSESGTTELNLGPVR